MVGTLAQDLFLSSPSGNLESRKVIIKKNSASQRESAIFLLIPSNPPFLSREVLLFPATPSRLHAYRLHTMEHLFRCVSLEDFEVFYHTSKGSSNERYDKCTRL